MAVPRDRGFRIIVGRMIAVALLAVFGFTAVAEAGGPKSAPKKPAPKKTAKPAPKKTAPAKPAPKSPAKPAPKKPQAKTSQKPTQIQVRARDVYFGRYRSFAKPAVLDTQKVFNAISYYRDLKSAGLTKKSGRYWILIQKSNKVFYKAMKRLAERQGFDLIGARDSIMIDGSNPVDVTGEIIKIIPTINIY